MGQQGLDRDSFIKMAGILGFDPDDPHLDELYPWVEQVLKAVEPLDELDLKGVEPDMHFHPGGEE